MNLLKFLLEQSEKDDKKKNEVLVYVPENPRDPLPNDTVSALEKEINKGAKDIEQEFESAAELVNQAFEELNIDVPQVHHKDRWKQYQQLISYSVKNLYDARGLNANWKTTI